MPEVLGRWPESRSRLIDAHVVVRSISTRRPPTWCDATKSTADPLWCCEFAECPDERRPPFGVTWMSTPWKPCCS